MPRVVEGIVSHQMNAAQSIPPRRSNPRPPEKKKLKKKEKKFQKKKKKKKRKMFFTPVPHRKPKLESSLGRKENVRMADAPPALRPAKSMTATRGRVRDLVFVLPQHRAMGAAGWQKTAKLVFA